MELTNFTTNFTLANLVCSGSTAHPPPTCFGWFHDQPTWSPDGATIAFIYGNIVVGVGGGGLAPYNPSEQSACDQRLNVYVMDADGSNRKRLTDNTGDSFEPVWSRDGTEIVFSRAGQNGGFFVMKADGSNVRRFVLDSGESVKPIWSRDGSKFAFVRVERGTPSIWVMDADGRNQHRVTDGQITSHQPAWSPDGTKLVFTKVLPIFSGGILAAGNYEIYMVNADGSNETRLTDTLADDVDPAWQPVVLSPSPPTLTSNQVTIKTWTLQGRTYAYVKLSFPNAGFRCLIWVAGSLRQRLLG